MRLNTKEDRLKMQTAQINNLIERGWQKETFSGLQILTSIDSRSAFILKVWRDTVSDAFIYKAYRTEEQRTQAIENVKKSYNLHAERKAAEPKRQTRAAQASGAIKDELKAKFPGVKFSVRSDNFSMGDSVDISWNDGPTRDEVEKITGKYQYGHFNGMDDMYEYTNSRSDIPQSKYVMVSRHMSKETETILLPVAKTIFEKWGESGSVRNASDFLYQIFSHCSIPANAEVKGIERTDQTCGLFYEIYKISFISPETEPVKEVERPGKVEVPEGQINIIKYSEKAIAVIGDTRPIKDKLKSLGGSFNFRLTCGPGWIFPLSKIEDIKAALTV